MYFNFKNRYFGSIHFNIYKENDVQLKKKHILDHQFKINNQIPDVVSD